MSKRCPSCGYYPIGPFTDNCPICAEPVRNVRSGGGGGGFSLGGMSPVVKGILLGVLVVVVLAAGCCGIGVWQFRQAVRDLQQQVADAQAQAEADRKARTVVVAAADLLKEFQKDPAAADAKYKGKYLELTGIVERIGKEREFTPFIILNAGDQKGDPKEKGDPKPEVKVECFFEFAVGDKAYQARIDGLKKGQQIIVRGEYSGQVSNVQLRMCEFPDLPRPAFWGGNED